LNISDLELKPEQLRRQNDPATFTFKTTAELPSLEQIIGQDRAIDAIDFGVDMPSQGYNIFAVGPAGSGRTTAVRQFLNKRASQRAIPWEWCYVYNFHDPRRPKAIDLPPGRASLLRKQMADLIEQTRREMPRAFEGEHYEQRRREIVLDVQKKQRELYQSLEQYLDERNFALIRSQMGLAIAPVLNGETLSAEDYQKLEPEIKKGFEDRRPELQEQFDKTMRETRELDRQAKQAIGDINSELAGFVVDNLMAEIEKEFGDCSKVLDYLSAVRKDMVENVSHFLPSSEEENQILSALRQSPEKSWFRRYIINVLGEAGERTCAPVIIEDNPTYHNLIGRIEHRAEFGAMVTDFTQIHAGALHRANGGYLVVEAKDLLANPLAWEGLKRALRNQEIKIEEIAQFYGLVATASLQPQPIPLDVKVVIIGDAHMYYLLYTYEEDFRDLFKVKAEFTSTKRRDEKTPEEYARFVGDLCRREELRHFDPGAMSSLLLEAARLAEDQEKVTTRFANVADLVRESSFWAGRNDNDLVTADDVRAAVDARIHRLNYAAERFIESVQDGVTLIDTQGSVVGQVNALSVIQSTGYEFGLPSRITAKTFMGRAGVVSIDREVKMSGPIHDKGQLILAAYLASRFAQKQPISMSASLTFEQSYGGIEGDSASSTELYALQSSLSGIPIKQNLAVTGSVNQFGQVQAIGGVNAKIQGFYDVCKERGLTGDQGVLIPASNVRHLMLRDEVVNAVAEGKFHIYAVSTIEEGIEILTGVPAGEPDDQGDYPEGTVYALIQAKLDQYAARAQEERGKDDEELAEEERGKSTFSDEEADAPEEIDDLDE